MIKVFVHGLTLNQREDLISWSHVHYTKAQIKVTYLDPSSYELQVSIYGTLSECAGICAHLEKL